jgi:(R)-2-hydroxyacyl-CoA dehydratese activating ATPase
MRYAGGVDVGSTQTKAVVVDGGAASWAEALIDTGANVVTAAQDAFDRALAVTGVDPADVAFVIGTGYGRYKVEFGDAQVTEIACHARGAAEMFPAPGPCSTWAGRTRRRSGSSEAATCWTSA